MGNVGWAKSSSVSDDLTEGRCDPYLLHLGVLLDVDLFASAVLQLHGAHGVQSDAAGEL